MKKTGQKTDYVMKYFSVIRIISAIAIALLIVFAIIFMVSDQPVFAIRKLVLGPLAGNDVFRFLRSRNAPHLAESIHIKWHIIHLALVVSHRAVGVAVKFCQTVDKIPYLPVAGMENVGAVFVDMDTFHIFTVDVAA